MADRPRILIVDDEQSLCEFLEIFLRKQGYDTDTVLSGEEAIERLDGGHRYDLVLTDLLMPGVGGLELLDAIRERSPGTEVVLMTAYATADTALDAMKKGAFDYVQKPFKVEEIRVIVDKALRQRRLVEENRELRARVEQRYGFDRLVGGSKRMQEVFELVRRVADTRTNVLITGESGTGKDLIARALHDHSSRCDGPMVPVSCGAIPGELMESELFGHVKGAFTGADERKKGMFEAAEGGTILLDEIGEVPMSLQVKLLRVLQERRIRPVGATRESSVDVRVIAATNRDLAALVREGSFREDLYYRLNVIHVEMPALRQRREDVPLIAHHFLQRFRDEMGKPLEEFSPEAMDALLAYHFPGNVRELENIVERAATLSSTNRIELADLPPEVARPEETPGAVRELCTLPAEGLDLEQRLAEVERGLLQQALERTGGNRTEAARLLGISFRSLRYKVQKYGVTGPRHEPS